MNISKRRRDSSGKYSSNKEENEEDKELLKVKSIWSKVKVGMALFVLLILSLPWTILIYEPTKNLSLNVGEMLSNMTVELRDNYCQCKRPSQTNSAL